MPTFNVNFTNEAFDDLASLRKFDHSRVTSAIDSQLTHDPNVETRHRKRLRPNQLAEWELRIGDFRVFYDVRPDELAVNIVAVGHKQGENLFIHGQPYQL